MNTVINITQATLLQGHCIDLHFDDGRVQTVDFAPFLQASRHPQVRAFLDPARFAAFQLQHGELVWGDYALCFPIIDLYENRLLHRADGQLTLAA